MQALRSRTVPSSSVRRGAHGLAFHTARVARPAAVTRSARQQRSRPLHSAASDEATTTTTPGITLDTPQYVEVDKDFSLSKISFGKILAPIGVTFMVYGFAAYITLVPGGDWSSILLVYGFPISLLGFALSYAQLLPVSCQTDQKAFELRGTQMTDIQKQVREDCTRFRYGDEQHLEEALDKIFKFNKPQGVPRRAAPKLVGLREQVANGQYYTLVLEFESPKLEFVKWEDRVSKLQSFFGPGIVAQLEQTKQGVDVLLVCDGSGKGRDGGVQKDVLPPLMPGLKARQQ